MSPQPKVATPIPLPTIHQYRDKVGKPYLQARYKDAEGTWRPRQVPVSVATTLADLEIAHDWFRRDYLARAKAAPPKAPIPELKSIRNLFEQWRQLPQVKNRENFRSLTGQFEKWVLPSCIADLDLEAEPIPTLYVEWLTSMRQHLAANSINNIFWTVRSFIDECRGHNLIPYRTFNPLADSFVIKRKNGGEPVQNVAGDENTIALEKAAVQGLLASQKSPPQRRARYWLALSSGLRDGELSGLQWQDLDLTSAEPTVAVRRQLRRKPDAAGATTKAPKRKSFRTLPLHPSAAAELKSWHQTGWKAYVGREPKPTDAVFPNQLGIAYHPNSALFLRKDMKKANLPIHFVGVAGDTFSFDFHSLRRSFASLLELECGVERQRIGALLGHKATSVAAQSYLIKNRPQCIQAIQSLPLDLPKAGV